MTGMNRTEQLAHHLINGYVGARTERERRFHASRALSMMRALPERQVFRAYGMFKDFYADRPKASWAYRKKLRYGDSA